MAPLRSVKSAVVTIIACGSPQVSTPICSFIPEVFFPRRSPYIELYRHFGCFLNLRLSLWFFQNDHSFSVPFPPTYAEYDQADLSHLHLLLTIYRNNNGQLSNQENHAEWLSMYSPLSPSTVRHRILHTGHTFSDGLSFLHLQALSELSQTVLLLYRSDIHFSFLSPLLFFPYFTPFFLFCESEGLS